MVLNDSPSIQEKIMKRLNRQWTSLSLLATLMTPAHAATFTVINTNDAGVGSLRDAITQANLTTAADEIRFDIPGAGPHTIAPLSALPAIANPVLID